MEIINWSEKLSVNNTLIDSQHKKLVSLINQLYSSMKEGKGKEILQKILDDLVEYTKVHFSTEENLMKQYNYREYQVHKLEHDKLTSKAVEIQKNFREGKTVLTIDVLNFLKDWLVNHIQGTDQKYKNVIKNI